MSYELGILLSVIKYAFFMSDSIIRAKSFQFAIRVVNAYKALTSEKKEFVMSKQLLRSGTAVGLISGRQ